MKNFDTYNHIPNECIQNALFFVERTTGDVKNYRFFQNAKLIEVNEKADKFCAWWNLQQYEFHPHSLITLYDAEEEIDEEFGEHNAQNVVYFLQHRLIGFYDLLKKEGMIEDGETKEN